MKEFHVKESLYIFFYNMKEMSMVMYNASHYSTIAGSKEC